MAWNGCCTCRRLWGWSRCGWYRRSTICTTADLRRRLAKRLPDDAAGSESSTARKKNQKIDIDEKEWSSEGVSPVISYLVWISSMSSKISATGESNEYTLDGVQDGNEQTNTNAINANRETCAEVVEWKLNSMDFIISERNDQSLDEQRSYHTSFARVTSQISASLLRWEQQTNAVCRMRQCSQSIFLHWIQNLCEGRKTSERVPKSPSHQKELPTLSLFFTFSMFICVWCLRHIYVLYARKVSQNNEEEKYSTRAWPIDIYSSVCVPMIYSIWISCFTSYLPLISFRLHGFQHRKWAMPLVRLSQEEVWPFLDRSICETDKQLPKGIPRKVAHPHRRERFDEFVRYAKTRRVSLDLDWKHSAE